MFSEFVMQNLLWFGALIVVFNLLIFSFLQGNVKGVKTVSPLQLPQVQRNGDSIVIDVNDSGVFATSHIPDSINFSIDKLTADNKALLKYKNSSVILVCQSGTKSSKAAKLLQNLGFNNIHILRGGLMAWAKENLPLSNSN